MVSAYGFKEFIGPSRFIIVDFCLEIVHMVLLNAFTNLFRDA